LRSRKWLRRQLGLADAVGGGTQRIELRARHADKKVDLFWAEELV
jgi:hypothetical protein